MSFIKVSTNQPVKNIAFTIGQKVQATQVQQSLGLLARKQKEKLFPVDQFSGVINKRFIEKPKNVVKAIPKVKIATPINIIRQFDVHRIIDSAFDILKSFSPTLKKGKKNFKSHPFKYRDSFRVNFNKVILNERAYDRFVPVTPKLNDKLFITNISPYALTIESRGATVKKRSPQDDTKDRYNFKGPMSKTIRKLNAMFPESQFSLTFFPMNEFGLKYKRAGKKKGKPYIYPAIRIKKGRLKGRKRLG